MKKKLYMELSQLAKEIYLDTKDDLDTLHEKSRDLYEKITVLRHVENSLNWEAAPSSAIKSTETSNQLHSTAEIQTIEAPLAPEPKAEPVLESKNQEPSAVTSAPTSPQLPETKVINEDEDQLDVKQVNVPIQQEQRSLSNELFADTATYDPEKVDEIFAVKSSTPEVARKEAPTEAQITASSSAIVPGQANPEHESPVNIAEKDKDHSLNAQFNVEKTSLNNKLNRSLQIGLNDRIAFVKQLFNGSQADYQRVVSQLSTFDSIEESLQFINNVVSKEYGWENKEDYAHRFVTIIEARFA